jgi:hypothetical protein
MAKTAFSFLFVSFVAPQLKPTKQSESRKEKRFLLTSLRNSTFKNRFSAMQSSTQVHREALQRQTQQDWANREYIELISGSIKRISDFLNSFDMSCR